jgi:hypothetical protein
VVTLSVVDEGVRALRLVAFATTATVLALGAHVLAGGAPPAALPTAAAIVVPAAAATALSRRRRRLLEIAIVLAAVQVVLHEVFTAAPAPGAGPDHQVHVGHGPDSWMPITHTLAVLITALLLTHGERMLHLLATWWRAVPAVWRALSSPVVPVRRPTSPVAVRLGPVPASLGACAPVVRRGPPVCVC